MSNKRRMIRQEIQSVLDKHEILDGRVAEEIADAIYNLIPQRITSKPDSRASLPEIQAFRQVTGYYPAKPAWDQIIELSRGKTLEQMQEAYSAWCFKGNNPRSALWLKWISNGSRNVVVS